MSAISKPLQLLLFLPPLLPSTLLSPLLIPSHSFPFAAFVLFSLNVFFVAAIIFAFVGHLNANSKQGGGVSEEGNVVNKLISAGIAINFGQ